MNTRPSPGHVGGHTRHACRRLRRGQPGGLARGLRLSLAGVAFEATSFPNAPTRLDAYEKGARFEVLEPEVANIIMAMFTDLSTGSEALLLYIGEFVRRRNIAHV